MKLLGLEMTTTYAPTQIEGVTDDHRPVYIRFRSAWLSVEVGYPHEPIEAMLDGFTVYEAEHIAASGSTEAITIPEVEAILAQVDLDERLSALEQEEQALQTKWKKMVRAATTRDIDGVRVAKLSLSGDLPWKTPYMNRVGKPEFEAAFEAAVEADVWVFFHTENMAPCVTASVSNSYQGIFHPLRLVEAGSQAFGGSIHGPSGGAGRADIPCQRKGSEEKAMSLIEEAIRAALWAQRGAQTDPGSER